MKKFLYSGITLLFLFILLNGCKELPSLNPSKSKEIQKAAPLPEGTILAQVGDTYVTLEEFEKETEAFNKAVASDDPEAKIDTPEKKSDYLQQMVNRRLLYVEAIKKGLGGDKELQKTVENFKISLLVAKLVEDLFNNIDVSSAEIEEYYNKIKDFLKEPQERKVREIVARTESEAREVLIELLRGADFASTAMQRSIVDSAKQGGDLGYIKPGSKGEKFVLFDEIVFAPTLDIGAPSSIFKGPEGFYIIKLEGIKEGRQPTLSEVWDKIKITLKQQKQQERLNSLIESLSKQTRVALYKENIK